jgi:hypothetical protein
MISTPVKQLEQEKLLIVKLEVIRSLKKILQKENLLLVKQEVVRSPMEVLQQ